VEPEKKTADFAQLRPERQCAIASSPFLTSGGTAQCRYERLRDHMLTEPADRPRTSPAQFDLRRFQRYGLLGLVDGAARRRGCGNGPDAAFDVQLIALEAEDARDRWARLFDLLARAVSGSRGGDDATGGTVCQGLDGLAGEGTDDPEPARRHYGLR
jgi:hypothetical protein